MRSLNPLKNNPLRNIFQNLFLVTSPLLASLSINLLPALADTFAFAEVGVFAKNFSHEPQSILTFAKTSTFVSEIDGVVTASAIALATFEINPALAQNYSLSTASGNGSYYFGLAQSFSAISGFDFSIQAKQTFSFDFGAFLNLQTSIDTAPEQAIASGDISFVLFDSTNQDDWTVLYLFQLRGNLSSLDNSADYLTVESSASFSYNPQPVLATTIFADNTKLASAEVNGKYSQYFTTQRNLSLIEFKNTQATVSVPVPSSLLGAVSFGLFFIYKVAKRKRAKLND